MPVFNITQGDTDPPLEVQLLQKDRSPFADISNETVVFYMYDPSDGTVLINNKSATVKNGAEAIVEYDWDEEDTEKAGRFKGKFKINPNGDRETWSRDDDEPLIIEIEEDK